MGRVGGENPIVGFDVHGAVEQLAEHRHVRMVVKRQASSGGETEDAHLEKAKERTTSIGRFPSSDYYSKGAQPFMEKKTHGEELRFIDMYIRDVGQGSAIYQSSASRGLRRSLHTEFIDTNVFCFY